MQEGLSFVVVEEAIFTNKVLAAVNNMGDEMAHFSITKVILINRDNTKVISTNHNVNTIVRNHALVEMTL